jgi:AcrR family transcriptional regulator
MMSLADGVVERSLTERQSSYAREVRQIVDATYRVIAETGTFDPPVRAILREAGLSRPAFYRHFGGKDELLLVMLDEGRRSLVGYLAHRISAVRDPSEQVAEWVRGVLAQAADPEAARLTRPFVIEVERLHERFPEQQQASEQLLLEQSGGLLEQDQQRWVQPIYSMTLGELARYLRSHRRPSANDVESAVSFVLAALGTDG